MLTLKKYFLFVLIMTSNLKIYSMCQVSFNSDAVNLATELTLQQAGITDLTAADVAPFVAAGVNDALSNIGITDDKGNLDIVKVATAFGVDASNPQITDVINILQTDVPDLLPISNNENGVMIRSIYKTADEVGVSYKSPSSGGFQVSQADLDAKIVDLQSRLENLQIKNIDEITHRLSIDPSQGLNIEAEQGDLYNILYNDHMDNFDIGAGHNDDFLPVD